MRRQVWKYPIVDGSIVTLTFPGSAKIVHFEYQNRVPQVWAEIDFDAADEQWLLSIKGTGWPIDDPDLTHQMSTISPSDFVWHLYAKKVL